MVHTHVTLEGNYMQILQKQFRQLAYLIMLLMGLGLLSSCAAPNPQKAAECSRLLAIASNDLMAAKAKGLSGTFELTKAAGLISAAKIQLQFNKYPNCIDKAIRARKFIRQAELEHSKH